MTDEKDQDNDETNILDFLRHDGGKTANYNETWDEADARAREERAREAAIYRENANPLSAALKRLRQARIEPGQSDYTNNDKFEFVQISSETDAPIMVRPDVSDRHTRGEVTIMAADPGVGKSTLETTTAVAIATRRPELIGKKSLDWDGAVVIVSNEDGVEPLRRQLKALMATHGIVEENFIFPIYVWGKTQTTLIAQGSGLNAAPLETPDTIELINHLTKIRENGPIALLIVDTLASAMMGVSEQDPSAMTAAMGLLRRIGQAAFCAVEVITHRRKSASGAGAKNIDAGEGMSGIRGTLAIAGSARCAVELVGVPTGWGKKKFGWTPAECERRVRLKGTKANGRPLASAQFYEFRTVSLVARDPRKTEMVAQDVGILVSIEIPPEQRIDKYDALKALVEAHAKGAEIRLGNAQGRSHVNAAKCIVARALEIDTAAAWRLVDELLGDGLLEEYTLKLGSRNSCIGVRPTAAAETELAARSAEEDEIFG